MDEKDLFFCCKTGCLSRIRYLVDKKDVDLNVKDKWGGSPLYYACLCGHYEVVLFLLQNGAQCDANTFDGERCVYGALTDNIRLLLLNFKVISTMTKIRGNYNEFLRRTLETSDYDFHFILKNEKISAHRLFLSCRSRYFHYQFLNTWKDKTSIDLTELNIPIGIFKILLQYLYMGEVSINKRDMKNFIKLAEHFCMTSLVSEIRKKLASNQKMAALYIQLQPLPQEDFRKLFLSSLPKELCFEDTVEELLYVDLHIKVRNYVFFCHKLFVCERCSYLKALVADHFDEASVCDDSNIQIITLHDTDARVFVKILQYIYTGTADLLPETVFDVLCLADVYILPGLKKLCASIMHENLSIDNIILVIKLAKLYGLPRLEYQCAEFIAEHLEEVINQPEFIELILEGANEIKNRQEVDTISIIDDIRYHIDRSGQTSNNFQKYLLIMGLLRKLQLNA